MTTTEAPAARKPALWINAHQAKRRGLQIDVFTAEEFADFLPAGGTETAFYQSIGHSRRAGCETFKRTRMRRGEGGIEILGRFDGCPAGTTQVISRYPFGQGRTVRVLTRRPS